MKKKLIILLLLTASNIQIKAQDYIPLLDTTNIWYMAERVESGDLDAYAQKLGQIDTLHDTAYYRVVSPNKDFGHLREDTIERLVFKGHLYGEDLLYDFSMQEGDSIQAMNYGDEYLWYYLDSIRTADIAGKLRKIFYLNNSYETVVWVEGIGSLAGLLKPGIEQSLEYWGAGELLCMEQNEEFIYKTPNGEQWGCQLELYDQTAPVADSIWFIPDTIASNDTVRIYVKATDDLSGVNGFYTYLLSPKGQIVHLQEDLIHEVDDIYYKDLIYCWYDTNHANCNWNEIGTWHTNFILMVDSVGNEAVKNFSYDAGFYVNEILGIKETSVSIINIFPNPVNNISNLIFPNPEHKTIILEIYDVYGKLVYSDKTTFNFFEISKTNFNSGIYIYTLSKNNQIFYSNKLIVQ